MKLIKTISALLLAATASVSQAAIMDFWATEGWNTVASEDQEGYFNYLDPGTGGQAFDAEYLFYRFDHDSNVLSLGLQTGFDVIDGRYGYYYTGDLALSFNGSNYDYAVDFGLRSRDYHNYSYVNTSAGAYGIDPAGFYSVSQWNSNILHPVSGVFAMDEGQIIESLLSNEAGYENNSYYRTVSFDLSSLGLGGEFDMGMHWTMSCGNDAINGTASIVDVPETDSVYLLGLGIFALIAVRRLKKA